MRDQPGHEGSGDGRRQVDDVVTEPDEAATQDRRGAAVVRVRLAVASARRAVTERLQARAEDRIGQRAGEAADRDRHECGDPDERSGERDDRRAGDFGERSGDGDAAGEAGRERSEGQDRTRRLTRERADLGAPRIRARRRERARECGRPRTAEPPCQDGADRCDAAVGEDLPNVARSVLADVDQCALARAADSRERDRGEEEGEQDESALPSAAEQRR